MPLVYADSSVLFAHCHPKDNLSKAVRKVVERHAPDFVYWSLLQLEVRHNLRLARNDRWGEIGWHTLRAAESAASRFQWRADLTADKMIDLANELSAKRAKEFGCGSLDFIHVAAARRLHGEIDEFWTGDQDQAALAEAEDLTVRLVN